MKNLNSIVEGVWIEFKSIIPTEEQKALMLSQEESDLEAKIALMAELKTQSEITPDKVSLALAKATYNYIKPTLSAEDVYEFIACNINMEDKVSGILNCRVNGEHKQIRF